MDSPTKKPRQSGSGLSQLAAGLTKRLAKENPSTNLVFSPLSIYTALSLLAAGARDATLDEILRVLGRSAGEMENRVPHGGARPDRSNTRSSWPSRAGWSDLLWLLKPAFREAVVAR
ncbi:hypothetical protein ZWY2020_059667 [Hordeum vulgare]|nr:hypothetical protein ZWY2020_059667 [Hordeum vulgare]